MNIERFISACQPRWNRLSQLLDRVEADGLESLDPEDLHELFRLYRVASGDLNRAQTSTGNPALLEFLESLVARGYAAVATPQRARPLRALWRALRHGFPSVVRRDPGPFGVSAMVLVAGMIFGWVTTAIDPELTNVFLPAEHLTQSPSERVEDLEELERAGTSQIGTFGEHAFFSSYLFTHNIRVALFALALGLTFGIGTVVVLFYNGVIIGSIAQNYLAHGEIVFFVAWVGPHGSIELPAIVFAGAAGLMLARAQWSLVGGTMWQRIAMVRRRVLTTIVATAVILVIAGLVEGGFSQVNEPTLPYVIKIIVAVCLFSLLIAYVFVLPVRHAEDDEETGGEIGALREAASR